ncbi:hypothetical protein KQX54_005999 [Cotesia glomerata]|uniref:Arrestin C-terminal-like domain-containing protein n=2 Tax=Cotesia glomerata TaxID=32391 RepID=A0AAV7I5P6_COTGL|nr:hypothetical protein KQX54_005999 [Cotesia glomerata]
MVLHVGKRDFVQHDKGIEPIDGVVWLDPDYVEGHTVYVSALAIFKYGDKSLKGMGFDPENLLVNIPQQVYPPLKPRLPLTPLQQKLMRKLGSKNVYPFCIELPEYFPNSVVLHPTPDNDEDPCGIVHELKAYISDSSDKVNKVKEPDFVSMGIRKVMYAPSQPGEQPTVREIQRFWFSDPLLLEASLDKEIYYHGETIAVNINITNYSRRFVKEIIVTVKQTATLRMFTKSSFTTTVAKVKSENGFLVLPDKKVSKVFEITPLLSNNRKQKRVAVDGQTQNTDTNLASSTNLDEELARKKNVGITVEYDVEIKVKCSFFRRWFFCHQQTTAKLPFVLMHPEPTEELSMPPLPQSTPAEPLPSTSKDDPGFVDVNLIDFKGDDNVDLIFEDFARERIRE